MARFQGDSLFDRVARELCRAGVLPRKELYESWETARRARRLFRGQRIVDVAGGHGLLAHLLLLLDDSSPSAAVVDPAIPPSSAALQHVLVARWPRLAGRVQQYAQPFETFEIAAADLIVSSHACGSLTDVVLDRATQVRAPVVVLPCCHDFETCDRGALAGWMDGALAIDARRVMRLEQAGYRVWTQTIPSDITDKNRLLLAAPLNL